MNFNDEMKKRVTEIKSIIEKYLPQEDGFQKTLIFFCLLKDQQ